MVLGLDKIEKLIEAGTSEEMKLARKKAKHRNMHITGDGLKDFLFHLEGYENTAQQLLREKLAKSNRSTFSFILRPMDKIFTAKGGAVTYNLPQNKIDYINDNISDIADGLDIKKYLKKKVKKEYVVDPNGVLFVDIDEKGQIETYVIPTNKIMWYKPNGNKVEAIIFEPYEKEEDKKLYIESLNIKNHNNDCVLPQGYSFKKQYYRVIDEKSDRIFIREKKGKDGTNIVDSIAEMSGSSIENYFGFVPALILGDEKCNNTGLFESVIEDLLEDADEAIRDISVKTVHKLAHAYPRYWAYAQACTKCDGEGTIDRVVTPAEGENPAVIESTVCSSCGGDGSKKKTDPSDEVVVPVPQDGDPILTKLMGFESPDLETAKFYEDLVEKAKITMFRSMWGTTYEVAGKRETATGRWLDSQPVTDRLKDMSYTFAKMHKFLLDCYGIVLLRSPKYQSSVTYGSRYILEGPDDILEKYKEVSRENVNDVTKMDLGARYLEAEYQDDPLQFIKKKKLYNIEPFPTMSTEKVMSLDFVSEIDKLRKLYFGEWTMTLTDEELIFNKEEVLKDKLTEFIKPKTLKNEQV